MSEVCHRCRRELPGTRSAGASASYPAAALSALDDEVVLYCPRCGAPQLRLPEHLRSAAADALTSSTGAPPPPLTGAFNAPSNRLVDWPVAIRCGGLIALVEVLGILILGLVPSEALRSLAFSTCLLLLCSAALIAVNLYARLAPLARLSGRSGLRIGLVCGLLLLAVCTPVLGFTGVLSRFLLHGMTSFDGEWLKMLSTMQISAMASAHTTNETQSTEQVFRFFRSPEGHGGLILVSFAFYSLFLLMFSSAAGALAGMLRASRPPLQESK